MLRYAQDCGTPYRNDTLFYPPTCEVNISFSKLGPLESEESPTLLDAVQSSPQTANLATQVDLDAFQAALIRWLCLAHN